MHTYGHADVSIYSLSEHFLIHFATLEGNKSNKQTNNCMYTWLVTVYWLLAPTGISVMWQGGWPELVMPLATHLIDCSNLFTLIS